MSEFEGMPECRACGHPAESHDDEFGNCTHLPNPYGMSQQDGCDCGGYIERAPMDSFAVAVIAVKLLRHLGMLNDSVYHARPHQMVRLVYAVTAMNADGCPFDERDIEELCGEGEESEVRERLGRFSRFDLLSQTLDLIFQQIDEQGAGDEEGLKSRPGRGFRMSVYVDDMRAPYKEMLMCHMIADTTEELVGMADRIGVKRKWIQYPGTAKEHFDICWTKRKLAVKAGAIEVTMRELCLRQMQKGGQEVPQLSLFERVT